MSGIVEAYDLATNTWATATSMPEPHYAQGATAGLNGLVYTVGSASLCLPRTGVEAYDPRTDSWNVDGNAPVIDAFAINGGARTSTTSDVTLSLTASDVGVGLGQVQLSNDGVSWSDWRAFEPTTPWTLPPGDGQKTVYARVRDRAGNVSERRSATITLDTTLGAEYGISINQAAIYTPSVDVLLSLPARSGTSQMQVSNDGGFVGVAWEPYAISKPWQITRYGDYVLPRTVYVRFKDAGGQVSSTFQDDIVLDVTVPTGTVSLPPNGTSAQSGPVRTVRLTASDDLSPQSRVQMRLSNRADFAGAVWQALSASASWDFSGGATVYAQFRDGAGNLSAVSTASLPGAPPPGTSPSVSCSPRPPVHVAAERVNGTLRVTLAVSGANNGLRAVRFDTFSNAAVDVGDRRDQIVAFAVSSPTGQEPSSLEFFVKRQSGAQGNGSATVRLVVVDGCGEWSTFVGGGSSVF
jgi:hypothetical protein